MKLRMDLNGIITTIKITGYAPSKGWDTDCWCRIDYSYTSEPWLNYAHEDDELFMPHEIEYIVERLKDFVSGEINEVVRLGFIEPDLSFIFYPSKMVYENKTYSMRPAYPTNDIQMDWRIRFWHRENGLTDNYLSMRMGRQDIEALLLYLRFVIGEVNISDKNIQKMIHYGYFLDS